VLSLRCKPADLAIIVYAMYATNLGRIVKIIRAGGRQGDIVFAEGIATWEAECAQPLSWYVGKKRYRRRRGPVPDAYLQPIRGAPQLEQIELERHDTLTPPERSALLVE